MSRTAFCVILLLVSVKGTGQSGSDFVLSTNCGSAETGIVAWGASPGVAMPVKVTASCGTAVSVGDIQEAPAGNQLVSYTAGHPPVLVQARWNDSNPVTSPITVSHGAPIPVPVKFWILHKKLGCDTACVRTWIENFLVWANDLLSTERAGIELVAADPGVVDDQTANTNAAVTRFKWVSETLDCKQTHLDALKAQLHTANALNVFLVYKVGWYMNGGTICINQPPVRDQAFVGHKALYGTLLHEIGHLLGLRHANGVPGLDHETNVMYSHSDIRKFLSEGQNFWMHFAADRSALPAKLGGNPGTGRNCEFGVLDEDKPCPALATQVWNDH